MHLDKAGEFIDIQTACSIETTKIQILLRDLSIAISNLEKEKQELSITTLKTSETVSSIDSYITQILNPQELASRSQLFELQSAFKNLAEVNANAQQVEELKTAREQLNKDKLDITSRPSVKLDRAALRKFCDVIEPILREWKSPEVGVVEFDESTSDLVVGGKPRQSNGKGTRALLYAGFVIGLMRYCEANDQHHTRFVVIDSPLTTFKGTIKSDLDDSDNDQVPDEVIQAFYKTLSQSHYYEQIIILENKIPLEYDNMNLIVFSGRNGKGREGFFSMR